MKRRNNIKNSTIMTELKQKYENFLKEPNAPLKIPFIETTEELTELIPVTYETTSVPETILSKHPTWDVLRKISLKMHNKTREKLIQVYQRGVNLSKVGRLRGNMEYVEDAWDVQIQPLSVNYAYIDHNNNLTLSEPKQAKIRDKYLKIRVRYDGTQYAIVNGIRTYFTISYA